MSRRLNTAISVVVPWEVPELDLVEQPLAAEDGFFEIGPELLDPKGWRRATDPPGVAPSKSEAESLAENSPLPVTAGEAPAPEPKAPDQAYLDGFERGLNEGREAGIAEGHAAAVRAAEPLIVERLHRLDAIVARLGEPQRSLERPVEEAVLALALEVARRVVVGEIAASRDFLVKLIREAVAKVPIDVGTPKIILHPDDFALVRSLAPDLEAHGVVLIGDETIEPGGCLVVADGSEGDTLKDRRWHPRVYQGICQVDLTLASRWRDVMLAMFEGEEV